MKGFTLKWNDKTISGAVRNACLGIIISNKDDIDVLRLHFGGMDEQGLFPEWCREDLKPGDKFSITYEDINEFDVFMPVFIRDVNDKEQENQLLLASYNRLKKKLAEEGLIPLK